MNHAHKNQAQNAAQKRREYLAKLAVIRVNEGFGVFLMLLSGAVSIFCLSWFMVSLLRQKEVDGPLMSAAGMFVILMVVGWGTRQEYAKRARVLPYVPPVAEQIANLPADEVLLRGSSSPAATPEALLRPVQAGILNREEELLRPIESGNHESGG